MKKTLVLGASTNPDRYANLAIHRLVDKNEPVVAFGLREGEIAGVKIHTEREAFPNIDTVTLYVGPKHQPDYYDYLISLKPRRVIFNPGTENPEFYSLLNKEGIEVEVACTLVLLGTDQY
ncbi:MAG: CoA-binding protein [Flavobacteriaceae bacterium]|nr:CoA-binding protein [Flavobacteriaceae bacterium]